MRRSLFDSCIPGLVAEALPSWGQRWLGHAGPELPAGEPWGSEASRQGRKTRPQIYTAARVRGSTVGLQQPDACKQTCTRYIYWCCTVWYMCTNIHPPTAAESQAWIHTKTKYSWPLRDKILNVGSLNYPLLFCFQTLEMIRCLPSCWSRFIFSGLKN